MVAGPISVTNPGSGFERRSSLAARSAFGIRDERETVTDANAEPSRYVTNASSRWFHRCVRLRDTKGTGPNRVSAKVAARCDHV